MALLSCGRCVTESAFYLDFLNGDRPLSQCHCPGTRLCPGISSVSTLSAARPHPDTLLQLVWDRGLDNVLFFFKAPRVILMSLRTAVLDQTP